ncbi:MAG: class I SAM-dependent methyltransferase [Phycisphaerales bacterium]|nr:class I SAM-dependent methyltransferase [Phycisphaerales bacterium]
MEENDEPILRYLYRHARPRRHLEFGTWEGRSALACLQECEATVWTINLREGEADEQGRWAYDAWLDESGIARDESLVTRTARNGRTVVRTDALGAIGHLVHEAGLGHRLCQVYCDSRQWDASNLPDGFFDSALIDGGHTAEVVTSDTLNALRLVRSGGLLLWHDYCPDPLAQETCASICGVVEAISRLAPAIRRNCSDWFWIEPSWILLAVRNDRPFDAGEVR